MKNLTLLILLLIATVSFAQKKIRNTSKMCRELTEMKINDQLHRKGEILRSVMRKTNEFSKNEVDSVWNLQLKIDNYNTKKLIKLTKKYGWLSDERTDCPKLNIWLIFRHSQEKYFEQIRTLIDEEHDAFRLNDSHYIYINNHLEGRPNMFD